MDLDLTSNKVRKLKLRSCSRSLQIHMVKLLRMWSWWVSGQCEWCHYKKGRLGTDRHRQNTM